MDLIKRGSQTAKDGFKNEEDIIKKFNNWKKDKDAQTWLILMKYDLSEIEYVIEHILKHVIFKFSTDN